MALTRSLPSNHPSRHLPEDVLSEILFRLPVKSLLKFRCVSKSWLALVDDDHFARLHLSTFKNNRDQNRLFVVEGRQENCVVRCADTFEAISQIPQNWWEIVSSVDGLVLLRPKADLSLKEEIYSLKLWNPSLRRFRQVPPIPHVAPYMPQRVIGLGYDLLAKDYKIVTLICDFQGDSAELAIYTVGADSWKIFPFQGNINGPSPWDKKVKFIGNVYLQGRLYVSASWDGYFFENRDLLWSFDLSNNVFSSISMPGEIKCHFLARINLFLVDGGSYVAMSYCMNTPIWVLETDNMVWAKRCLWTTNLNRPLYGKKNGDMLISRINVHTKSLCSGVALYKVEEHEYKILQPRIPKCIPKVSTYIESLILNK